MQMNLVEIKELLSSWYLLTLENPIYAGVLVVSVWLLTVFFYSIKIFFLNKQQSKTQQQVDALKGQVEAAQQHMTQSEVTLAELNAHIANEQQQASELTAKIDERNQDVINKVKEVASKFDLSEQLVDSGEKAKLEFIWQQQDNIQMQLADRLQTEKEAKEALQLTYQQEKEQFVAKNAVIETLQSTVDEHLQKVTQLEQDVAAHKQSLQQQEAAAKLTLVDTTEKHKLELVSVMAELGKHHNEALELANIATQQPENVMETLVEDKGEVTEELLGRDAALILKKEQQGQGFMGMGKSVGVEQAPVAKSRAEEVVEPEPVADEVLIVNEPVPELAQEAVSTEPEYEKSNLDISGKFKGLFGQSKKTAAVVGDPKKSAEVLVVDASVLAQEPETPIATAPDYAKSSLDISEKFKGMFGKSKKTVTAVAAKVDERVSEPDITISTVPNDAKPNLDIAGKFKDLFGKSKQSAVVTEPESIVEVLAGGVEKVDALTVAEKTDSAIAGKVKGILGRSKKAVTAKVAAPVESEEVLIIEEPPVEVDVEEGVLEPDYGASNIKMPKVFKGLFGKK